MSGFPVPAKAVEAAARELHGIYYNGCVSWEDTTDRDTSGDESLRRRACTDAWRVLAAALPALAVDPDLIEQLAEALLDAKGDMYGWEEISEFRQEHYRGEARGLLAALFGVASPSTKETRDA